MSINIPGHFTSQFSTDVRLLLQERGMKLRSLVSTGDHQGEQASPVNQIGALEARTPPGRFAPKERDDAAVARRWVFPQDKETNQLLDEFDMVRLIENPKPAYAEAAAKAIGRAMDDAIIDAAFATAHIGKSGSSTEAFDTSTYNVAVGFGAASDVGLTVDKLIEVRRIFEVANVDLDMEELTIVISPNQERDLLRQAEVVSTDYNDRPVLVDGRVKRFLGFNIVNSNRLSLVSGARACIAFVKSGMYLGMWQDMKTTVSIRNDLTGEPWQLYNRAVFGATRLEQGRVVRVLCNE